MSNNKIYIQTERRNFRTSVSKSIISSRYKRIFGLNARARNTIELTITIIVIMTHDVDHGQFPCHISKIPDPTSTCPACFTIRIAAWNTSNCVSSVSLFWSFILFNTGKSTKNGPIDKIALNTCVNIIKEYIELSPMYIIRYCLREGCVELGKIFASGHTNCPDLLLFYYPTGAKASLHRDKRLISKNPLILNIYVFECTYT